MPLLPSPRRALAAFRFLHTVFVIVRRKDRFLGFGPLSPAALRRTILDLGVSFIKLAQVLATRADFFTEDYLVELRSFHDEIAPMSPADLDRVLKLAYGPSPPFAWFDPAPLASATIGQVHAARLPDGARVAVKLRRLGIMDRVRADVAMLRFLLSLFAPFFSGLTRNSLDAVLSEFGDMITREADLDIERANLVKFAAIYKRSGPRFPRPYPEFSNADALVMSFEDGRRIDDKAGLAALGVPFERIMDELIGFYAEQMLVRGFFHADPHPGNILVGEDGKLVFLDFGMVKRLPTTTRVAMIELVKAAHLRDFEQFTVACKRLGIIAPAAPEAAMAEFAERMFDIFGNENLSAASMQALAFEVLDSMRALPFKAPQDVVYVMRASALIEGLGATYIENFNGVKDILPVLLKNLPRALGAGDSLVGAVKNEILSLPLTIRRVRTVLTDLSEGALRVRLSPETVDVLAGEARALLRPVAWGLVFLAGAILFMLSDLSWRGPAAGTLFVLGALRLLTALR